MKKFNKIYALIALSILTVMSGYSATLTWVGNTSTSWTTGSNWNTGNVPNVGDNVIINGNASNYPVLTSNVIVLNFTINGGTISTNGFNFRALFNLIINDGVFDAGSSEIRANNIDLNNGDFLLQGDKLTLGNDFTIDGGSLYIDAADFEVDDDLFLISGLMNLDGNDLIVSGDFTLEGGYLQQLGDLFINNFIIDFNATETLGTNLRILGSMTFTSGILITDENATITFDNNATVNSAKNSSHINGPVTKELSTATNTFTFPTGNGSVYAPIQITDVNDEQAGDFYTAQYFYGQNENSLGTLGSGLDHISQAEYWILDRGTTNVNNTPTTDARVGLFYDETTRSGQVTDAGTLRVARWDGSEWVNEGRGSGSSNNNTAGVTLTTNRVTSFSPFTLGSSNGANPLPIVLIDFMAKATEVKTVDVKWSTSSELDNDYFTIERSLDGINWIAIGMVESAGNTERVTNYSYTDKQPVVGTQYYRLKQTDLNGEYSYSSKVPVKFNGSNIVSIYPMPASTVLNVELNGSATDTKINIYNVMGQNIINSIGNGNHVSIDIENLESGVYVLEIIQDGIASTTKFVKN